MIGRRLITILLATYCLAATISIVLVCHCKPELDGNPKETKSSDSGGAASTATKKTSSLPSKLVDYKRFKKNFNKNYNSTLGDMYRQTLYTSRFLRVASSVARFIQKKSTCYLSINQMSDWTEKEWEATLLKRNEHHEEEMEAAPKSAGCWPFLRSPFTFLNKKNNRKRKRRLKMKNNNNNNNNNNNKMKKKKDDSGQEEFMLLMSRDTTEAGSLSALQNQSSKSKQTTLTSTLRSKGILDKLASTVKLLSPENSSTVSKITDQLAAKSSAKEAGRDHRKSGCLKKPAKDQGLCASCFIFSTLALYEWMYCRGDEDGRQLDFSEQFVIDCGRRMGVRGCSSGGTETSVALFSKKHGFELQSRYRYEGGGAYPVGLGTTLGLSRERKCGRGSMRSSSSSSDIMGIGWFADADIKRIDADEFDEFLDLSPILTGVYVSSNFQQYGGGIDDGDGCEPGKRRLGHAMLLIGDGQENGIDYWLYRNSHGPNWGERGHYKLAKASRCAELEDGIGYVPATVYYGEHDFTFKRNPAYDETMADDDDEVVARAKPATTTTTTKPIGFMGRLFKGWQ